MCVFCWCAICLCACTRVHACVHECGVSCCICALGKRTYCHDWELVRHPTGTPPQSATVSRVLVSTVLVSKVLVSRVLATRVLASRVLVSRVYGVQRFGVQIWASRVLVSRVFGVQSFAVLLNLMGLHQVSPKGPPNVPPKDPPQRFLPSTYKTGLWLIRSLDGAQNDKPGSRPS